jgi:hypothetical protein
MTVPNLRRKLPSYSEGFHTTMIVRPTTPDEARAAAPKETRCDRCGSEQDLRLVILRGRVRYVERTVCDPCAEELLEAFIEGPIELTAAERGDPPAP